MFIDELKKETTKTYTENGALTYSTSLNSNLDFFFTSGAMRESPEEQIIDKFAKAIIEDKKLALANLWYARDIRNGRGERRVANICLKYLVTTFPDDIDLHKIVSYGRYSDVLFLLDTPLKKKVLNFIKDQLDEDLLSEHPSLLAKWLPSLSASNKDSRRWALKISKSLFKCTKQYRKTLSLLRERLKIVERNLAFKEYEAIDYSKIPSKALKKYTSAFYRHDNVRFCSFLDEVNQGKKKINTSTIAPDELIKGYFSYYSCGLRTIQNEEVINTMWKNLPNVFGDIKENSLVLCDTSGSMYDGRSIAISIGLAIYIAERNRGAFHNHFMWFSGESGVAEIKGETIRDKLNYIIQDKFCANTNLQAAFDAILTTAISHKVPLDEMPKRLYVISDMEFDDAVAGHTNFEVIKDKYKKAGYPMPQLIFWNTQARRNNVPVRFDENGVALVSGSSINELKNLITSSDLSPINVMLKALEPYM